MSLLHKLRLIFAGILISGAAVAQVGGGSGTSARATTDASSLTTGELADARLSANVPLLDAANTFSALNAIAIEHVTAPALLWSASGAGVDEKRWQAFANSAGQWVLRHLGDSAGADNVIILDTTGTNVDSIALTADSITANGAEVATAANLGWAQVSGAGVLEGSGGFITGASRSSAGQYSVTFPAQSSATSYACTVSPDATSTVSWAALGTQTTSQVLVRTWNSASALADNAFHIICVAVP